MALAVVGATSTGGLTTLVLKRLRGTSARKKTTRASDAAPTNTSIVTKRGD
jgi:hypothetical protein